MAQDALENFGAYREARELFDFVVKVMRTIEKIPACSRLIGQQVASADSISGSRPRTSMAPQTSNDGSVGNPWTTAAPRALEFRTFHRWIDGLGSRRQISAMKVAIVPEPLTGGEVRYRAIAGEHQVVARTAGAALDALAAELPDDEGGTLVIVQRHRPDQFFNLQQQRRLAELMARWREARDGGGSLSPEDQAELEALVDVEVRASAERTSAILHDLGQ